MLSLPISAVAPRRRFRSSLFIAVGAVLALGLAGVAAFAAFAPERMLALPFAPDAANGHLESAVSIDDDHLPAIANLDSALRDAVRDAAAAAASEGIAFEVTSGWRSAALQQWLFDDAVRTYASEEVARQYVASPERSHHVTGQAVDIGNLDAQLWLMQHGAQWGLCQIYANERWHFERATEPGGVCPEQLPDAAG